MNVHQGHPLETVKHFLSANPEVAAVEMSVYQYRPQSVEDERKSYSCHPESLAGDFERLRLCLRPNEEIAFHSRMRVLRDGREIVMHMPMIDFKSNLTNRLLDNLTDVSKEFSLPAVMLFDSGRSYHLYGMQLLAPEQWMRFMARILLLNMPAGPEQVDCRWVGHRLLAGFASLRWTHNTANYRSMPQFVRELSSTVHNHR